MNDKAAFETITFGAWLIYWFETFKKPIIKPNSARNIEQMIRLHTPEELKEKRVAELTIFDIDKALAKIPVSRTYVYVRQVWHSALVKACRYGIIRQNPVDLCERVKYKKNKGKALTYEEQRELINRLEKSRYKWLILFYMYTGTRRNEAIALEWNDINRTEKLIQIKGTKTETSARNILLTDEVETILNGQKKQNEERGIKGRRVFPYSAQQASRHFKTLCPNHHLHELRHTFITRCAESGVNVNVCQQLVGHASADMTINVYTHVMDEFKRKEAAKFSLFPIF